MAAFGGLPNMFCTDSGNSVCSVSLVPPGSQSDFTMPAIVVSASLTDGSVHGILCEVSWSYLSAPACDR